MKRIIISKITHHHLWQGLLRGVLLAGIVLVNLNLVFAETLVWEDVLAEAEKKNPRIISADQSLKSAGLSYRNAFTNFLPQLSASAGWRKSSSITSFESFAEGGREDEEFNYGISGRLSVFSGFKNSSKLKQERAELKREEAEFKRTFSDTIYDLKVAFAQVLKAQKTISLSEEILKRRKENTQIVKLRYEAGREDKGAYLRSEADLYQTEYEFSKAERNLKTQQVKLLKEMGRDEFKVITVSGTFKVVPPERILSFQELLVENPDYLVARYGVDSAKYNLRYARGAFYPQISFSGSTSRSGPEWPLERARWNFGLSLSYPFFSGGKEIYDLKIARTDKVKSEEDFREIKQQILLGLEQSYNGLIDAVENVKVKEKYFVASEERAKISRVKYINGLISYQDWDTIENEFINSKKSLLEAEFNAFVAGAEWKRVLGKGE
ncbi:TolC family protein [bacterium]|nr:TolC family protein [bacterium]NIN93181.1 TolC family protein [bacterium]NIO18978.1 TolC family protein [bacterium]NIO74107.1 TolC family protein [bacterium]